jgi:hypothetical protein
MAKELKLYVPVVTKAIVNKKASYKVTLINASGVSTFRGQIPSVADIGAHMEFQKRMINQNRGEFNSLKVYVAPELYANMCREIGRKMGAHYHTLAIDLIMSSGQVPIIQIIANKDESKQNKAVEVEKTPMADEQPSAVREDIKKADAEV